MNANFFGRTSLSMVMLRFPPTSFDGIAPPGIQGRWVRGQGLDADSKWNALSGHATTEEARGLAVSSASPFVVSAAIPQPLRRVISRFPRDASPNTRRS